MLHAPSLQLPATDTQATHVSPLRFALGMWAVLIACSAPAVYFSQDMGGDLGGARAALWFIVGSYLPWVLATPLLWALCRRWPLGVGRDLQHAGGLLLVGVVATPLLSAAGWVLGGWLGELLPWGTLPARPLLVRAVGITALFAAPTFVAVIGIGQTVVFVRRYHQRGALIGQARLTALRQHLQHHFLFNALNAIGGLGYRQPDAADRALARLAQLLRDSMACPPQRALAEEVAAATEYLELQRLLRDTPLDVEWQVAGAAWRCAVPSLLLQPLLENAVRHSGWEQGSEAMHIRVEASVSNAVLHLVVRNPRGMGNAAPPSGSGTGLHNLRQRLQALHGSAATLRTDAQPQQFSVVLQLPVQAAA